MEHVSLPLVSAALWVLAATGVALLPMHRQYAPGLALLVAAPLMLVWIAVAHGAWIALAGLVAFVSMFRHPLRYLARKAVAR